MNLKKILTIGAAVLVACMLVTIVSQDKKIERLTDERDKYRENTETLLEQTQTYKVQDSLNAAKVGTLELTIKELEKYRADDAQLAKDLTSRNYELEQLSKAQARMITELRCTPRDTIILIDSTRIDAKSVHCGDEWYTFDGLLTNDTFTGTMTSRDEIVITENVKYKRILFWKTKKVKDRQLNAASRNPHTTITNLEHIIIDD